MTDSSRAARSTRDRPPGQASAGGVLGQVSKDLYPFESNWLDLDGIRYHYLDEGPRNAPPVVMLHGNPTWSFYYRTLIPEISQEYRVIVPDHVGCGLSDKPQDYAYTLDRHIENLERLVAHLDLTHGLTLVMHDWGGMIGMGYATRHPENVDRFVVFNTVAFYPVPLAPWGAPRVQVGDTPLSEIPRSRRYPALGDTPLRWGTMGHDGARWGTMGHDGARWGTMGYDGARWGTGPFGKPNLPLRIKICRLPVLGDLLVRRLNGFARLALPWATVHRERLTPQVRAGYLAPYDSWEHRIAILRFVQDIPLERRHRSRQTLENIEANLYLFSEHPMLIIWGAQDFCFTVRHYLTGWQERFPYAETRVVEDAGHYVVEDAHERIVPWILEFLATNKTSKHVPARRR